MTKVTPGFSGRTRSGALSTLIGASESYPFDSEKDLNLEALPSAIDSRTVLTG